MRELKLLSTRPDARVAVLGQADAVSKYLAETEQNLNARFEAAERAGSILFFDEADGLFGKQTDVDAHDGPVVIGARSLQAIPTSCGQGSSSSRPRASPGGDGSFCERALAHRLHLHDQAGRRHAH